MQVFNVTGSVCESLTARPEPFSMNVCALSRRDALAYAQERCEGDGWTGIVLDSCRPLGTAAPTFWRIGATLRVS